MTVAVVVSLAYVSLFVELVFLHVPSVASSRSILLADPAVTHGYSGIYRTVHGLPLALRLLLFVLPIAVIYAVFALPLLALATGANPLGDDLYSAGQVAQLAGLALILVGRMLSLWAVLSLRNAGGESRDAGTLHTNGPFSRVRNPGLLGMYLFVFGLWAITPSLLMLIGILVYLLHMDFKVRMEENFLGNNFGSEYETYRDRTGRYLP